MNAQSCSLSHAQGEQSLPVLAADLTWVRVNGGVTASALADWDEDRAPVVGERVLVSDGGPFVEAIIDTIRLDGTIGLLVPLAPDSLVS